MLNSRLFRLRIPTLIHVGFLLLFAMGKGEDSRPKSYGELISEDEPIYRFLQQIRDPGSLQAGGDCLSVNPNCQDSQLYRNYDGRCNNLGHPSWGGTNDELIRLLPPAYQGSTGFRVAEDGGELPQPRDIRLKLLTDVDKPSDNVTFTFLIFGLGVAHDVSFSTPPIAQFLEPKIRCCPPETANDALCAHIPIRPDDPFYSKYNVTCINFQRSPTESSCYGRRNINNTVTAFMDLSIVYGSDVGIDHSLRTHEGGKLISVYTNVGELLPSNTMNGKLFCPAMVKPTSCFNAGDDRVNEHSLLMSVHTLLLREHNRIAARLQQLNPHWTDEEIFQQARRITIAEYQSIAYGEYIPQLIGPGLVEQLGLKTGDTSFYDSNIRVGAMAEFTTCANRPHTMVQKKVGYGNLRLLDLFFNTDLIRDGHMGDIVKGMCTVPSEKFDRFQIDDLTNHLYQESGQEFGVDMASIDIHRGRDHGLPRYVDVLEYCSGGQIQVEDFKDLRKHRVMTGRHVSMLRELYRNVRDIDLYVGLQMERLTVPGSVVNPTAACIFARQFYALKSGDRFYFENERLFTPAQVASLRQSSFSRLICDNTEITDIQANSLRDEGPDNPVQSCDSLPTVDLTLWEEYPYYSK